MDFFFRRDVRTILKFNSSWIIDHRSFLPYCFNETVINKRSYILIDWLVGWLVGWFVYYLNTWDRVSRSNRKKTEILGTVLNTRDGNMHWFIDWLIDWLVGWLNMLIGWLNTLVGWLNTLYSVSWNKRERNKWDLGHRIKHMRRTRMHAMIS